MVADSPFIFVTQKVQVFRRPAQAPRCSGIGNEVRLMSAGTSRSLFQPTASPTGLPDVWLAVFVAEPQPVPFRSDRLGQAAPDVGRFVLIRIQLHQQLSQAAE